MRSFKSADQLKQKHLESCRQKIWEAMENNGLPLIVRSHDMIQEPSMLFDWFRSPCPIGSFHTAMAELREPGTGFNVTHTSTSHEIGAHYTIRYADPKVHEKNRRYVKARTAQYGANG